MHAYIELYFYFSMYLILMVWNGFSKTDGLDVAFMSFGPVSFFKVILIFEDTLGKEVCDYS